MTKIEELEQKVKELSEELAEWLDNKTGAESCSFCICMSSLFCNYKCIEGIKAYLESEE